MGFLQNAAITLLIFIITFISGVLGVFHFASTAPINTAAQTSVATTTPAEVVPLSPDLATTTARQTFQWVPFSVASDSTFNYYLKNNAIYISIEGYSTAFPSSDQIGLLVAKDSTGSLTPYSKDNFHVYYADPSNTRDGATVYTLPGANPSTFRVVFEGQPHMFPMYAEDKTHVFISAYIIPDADPNTFAVLQPPPIWYTAWYSKDANHVFYDSDVVPGADPNTFVVFSAWRQIGTNNYDAADKNHLYLHGIPL